MLRDNEVIEFKQHRVMSWVTQVIISKLNYIDAVSKLRAMHFSQDTHQRTRQMRNEERREKMRHAAKTKLALKASMIRH